MNYIRGQRERMEKVTANWDGETETETRKEADIERKREKEIRRGKKRKIKARVEF